MATPDGECGSPAVAGSAQIGHNLRSCILESALGVRAAAEVVGFAVATAGTGRPQVTRGELAAWWRYFSETECRGYSSLYEHITLTVAQSTETLDFLLSLPSHAMQPNMLLAAVHDRVLQGLEPELASHYDGRGPGDVGPAFIDAVHRSRAPLAVVLNARRTQTNEIGRIAFIVPALAALDLTQPPTLVDVGTSAGLTLTLEHCRIDYGPHGALGPFDSPVRVQCDVLHGNPPVRPVAVAGRIGLDRNPLDPAVPEDFRWLVACTWPDTGRLSRTRAALELAAAHPSALRAGDAVDDLPALLRETKGAVVITTTWVMAYLPPKRRTEFAECLADASASRPVFWVSAEGIGVVESLPSVKVPPVEGISASVLGVVGFSEGRETSARVLAHVHPHGRWLWWHD